VFGNPGLAFGQRSHTPDISNISTDPNIIIYYCKQFEDTVAMGMILFEI
jgi:hypothetical protein